MTVYDYLGVYGPGPFRQGVLSEHVSLLEAAGYSLLALPSTRWVVDEEGKAWPVVCSELIRVFDEDGVSSGRCGEIADADSGACEGHAVQIEAWREEDRYATLSPYL